ncbi:hypothetical protein ABZU86_30605 [Streptomyces sp. NPDC005271]
MQGAFGHGGPGSGRPLRSRRGKRLAASLASVTAIVLFAGACSDSGSESEEGAGNSGGSGSSSNDPGGSGKGKSTLAYAKCMRENGVKNFPDPNAQGLIDLNGNQVDMKSSQAQAADKKCRSLLPPAGNGSAPEAVRKASLDYAKCMRKNGVKKFPDPNAEGGLDVNGETLGVDPNGQVFKDADKVCQPILEKAADGAPKEVSTGQPK